MSVDETAPTGIEPVELEPVELEPAELDPKILTGSEDEDAADALEQTGHFRVYLGAAAGVGKTYAMLNEGIRRKNRGTDVVVAFVECHGRPLTEGLVQWLEVLPRATAEYRGSTFEEMDLDAVIARRPALALVDELAHTNVPGSGRNEKRWQDVLEILDAGIDVITTVNIQHLESIADAVEQMVGVEVRERVPDWVLRKADQIELVDSSPEQLRRRMLHGNIYPAEKVPQALTHFFRADNLTALRELALRFLADETEEELLERLHNRKNAVLWETRERIMVGITTAPGTDIILRRAARLAARTKGELHAVHVVNGDGMARDEETIAEIRQVALDVGAKWVEIPGDDPAKALMAFAREAQITQIVLGASRRSRWRELLTGGSIVWKVQRLAASESVDVHIIARSVLPPETEERVRPIAAAE
jgi:two-component system sensor histidine kinase KdpD